MALLLITIGILLIIFNVRAFRKETSSFESVLNSAENNMNDFLVEIGKLRREFSETILELQSEIEILREKYENFVAEEDKREVILEQQEVLEQIKNFQAEKTVELEKMPLHKEVHVILNKEHPEINKTVHLTMDKNIWNEGKNNIQEIENRTEELNNDIGKNKEVNSAGSGIKINEIAKLINEGFEVDEIAEKLSIGKGEVLLIKELYLR